MLHPVKSNYYVYSFVYTISSISVWILAQSGIDHQFTMKCAPNGNEAGATGAIADTTCLSTHLENVRTDLTHHPLVIMDY